MGRMFTLRVNVKEAIYEHGRVRQACCEPEKQCWGLKSKGNMGYGCVIGDGSVVCEKNHNSASFCRLNVAQRLQMITMDTSDEFGSPGMCRGQKVDDQDGIRTHAYRVHQISSLTP